MLKIIPLGKPKRRRTIDAPLSLVNSVSSSEKLNLSRKRFLIRRREKTMSALRPIHVSGSAVKGKVSCEDDSSVLNGFWSS